RVDDGRGGYDSQTFSVLVIPASSAGAIYGTKYNDQDGNGVRNDPTPGAQTLGALGLQGFAVNNAPVALDYYQPGNALVEAVSSDVGADTALYLVSPSGAETLFAFLPDVRIADGNAITAVQPGNAAGFTPGDIFLAG